MGEQELREWLWQCSVKHIIAGIEAYSTDWQPNGSAKHVADAIMNKIRTMPVPKPEVQR